MTRMMTQANHSSKLAANNNSVSSFLEVLMNNKQLDALIKAKQDTQKTVDRGLTFRIARGKPSWVVKYTLRGKRAQIALPHAYPKCSITEAKRLALDIRAKVKDGIDPKAERAKAQKIEIGNVNELFEDWFEHDIQKRLKHPEIPKRIYTKEIKPYLGHFAVVDVTPTDIRVILQEVSASGRPSTTNQTLMYAKQMFRHAVKLNLIVFNPAQPFTQNDAGGIQESRERFLTESDIQKTFATFRQHKDIFTRENYLACCLLLCLGVRKTELTSAQWKDFDLENGLWYMPEDNKVNTAITIPLPDLVLTWLEELRIRACGSDYVFPARRASKRRGYISDDTLNHALAKLFGKKVDSKKKPYPNYLGQAGVEHFTIHDLRRTCRTLLSSLNVAGHIAERCLNHSVKNKHSSTEAIYDRHDFLDERREALDKLAEKLAPYLV
ncbi:tyrosine-type recombinase/integrase [Photobacterium atrarenae]|uniref:Tyrosine-type recombinase/integrase n=1 Tax=Photobacterium atrarenae TaxID=865757 RepID=A0ABY5GFI9_9GAMM|nr:site-specific integrase [Photobacterium atrarenae]UTV27885.1 tyrosine-type recombinase/integrase [Photobacterium atrarenae]